MPCFAKTLPQAPGIYSVVSGASSTFRLLDVDELLGRQRAVGLAGAGDLDAPVPVHLLLGRLGVLAAGGGLGEADQLVLGALGLRLEVDLDRLAAVGRGTLVDLAAHLDGGARLGLGRGGDGHPGLGLGLRGRATRRGVDPEAAGALERGLAPGRGDLELPAAGRGVVAEERLAAVEAVALMGEVAEVVVLAGVVTDELGRDRGRLLDRDGDR